MKVLEAILVIVLAGGFGWAAQRTLRSAFKPRPQWKVETHTRPDGSCVVELRRPGEAPRMIGPPLPAGMDTVDFQSELRIRKEDAELEAQELNRSERGGNL